MPDSKQTPQPPQKQDRQPGIEAEMTPQPQDRRRTGAAAASSTARSRSSPAATAASAAPSRSASPRKAPTSRSLYLDEHEDAEETKRHVEAAGRKCLRIAGDIGDEGFCGEAVEQTARVPRRRLDILVNNAAEQHSARTSRRSPKSSWSAPSAPTSSATST